MQTITITEYDGTDILCQTRTWAPNKEGARNEVEARIENFLNGDRVTGGKLGDWRNVTLYFGASDKYATIVTTNGRNGE